MRFIHAASLVTLILCGCCNDPLGQQREQFRRSIEDYENECGNLELLTTDVEHLSAAVDSLRPTVGKQIERLGDAEGCDACAAALQVVLDSATPTTPTEMPTRPVYRAPPAVDDGLDALVERQDAMIRYRDGLRMVAENKSSWEIELEALAESHGVWDTESCAPAACQAIKDTCTADGC